MARILVVGSANQDHLIPVGSLPVPGETLLGGPTATQPGGKGANQAVAAARLGADVTLIGAVGKDQHGTSILDALDAEGVRTSEVETVDGAPTGLAMIYVLESGDNAIIVIPGANGLVAADRVAATLRRTCEPGALVVAQAEVPLDVVDTTARVAAELGARLVLNLAPYAKLDASTLASADPVVVNETEAAALAGLASVSADNALEVARRLTAGSRSVVVTLGAQGAVWATPEASGTVPAPRVAVVVDTAGAGDAFVGALAYRLSAGGDLASAVELGVAAGSFSVGRIGAQSSYPRAGDLVH